MIQHTIQHIKDIFEAIKKQFCLQREVKSSFQTTKCPASVNVLNTTLEKEKEIKCMLHKQYQYHIHPVMSVWISVGSNPTAKHTFP